MLEYLFFPCTRIGEIYLRSDGNIQTPYQLIRNYEGKKFIAFTIANERLTALCEDFTGDFRRYHQYSSAYLYWDASTIAITDSEDFQNPEAWKKLTGQDLPDGIRQVNARIRFLSSYSRRENIPDSGRNDFLVAGSAGSES